MTSWWDGASLRRRVYVGLMVLLVGFAAGVAADPKGLRHWAALGEEAARLEVDNARLRGDIDALRRKAEALRGDPRALERSARENGYVRPDEVLFELH
jgi:cell division protein FtsB